MKKHILTALLLLNTPHILACTPDGSGGILPLNDLLIPPGDKDANMTEDEFNEAIDKVTRIYEPIIAGMGGKLVMVKQWSSSVVNAFASRTGENGSQWQVDMHGGFARYPSITPDGLTLTVCHEIGHHLGGAPRKRSATPGVFRWASTEGQSDYFATLKCLRKVFASEDNATFLSGKVIPEHLQKSCDAAHGSQAERDICVRSGLAGHSFSLLSARMQFNPEFHTPAANVVASTQDQHPAAQCRLDTFFQGALCEVSDGVDVSPDDEVVGTCHGLNGQSVGLRPACWFKARTE